MTQEEALDILKLGHITYLTGPAGSGKTHVLRSYVSHLEEHGVEVAVTASTGIAATHLSGQTIHSWSGMGVKDEITSFDLDQLESRRGLWKRFETTQVLIIDEVSMLAAHQIDMIDTIARHMKRNSKPFGGMQVVFSGDFFQLPPINRTREEVRYAFESRVWSEALPIVCYLDTQYRQKDPAFFEVLRGIRTRQVNRDVRAHLESRIGVAPPDENEFTKLFTHNVDVDTLNEKELKRIDGYGSFFEMSTRGSKRLVETLKNGCLAPEKLHLKKGAAVMFVKNDPKGAFVNGTLGTVLDLEGGAPRVKTNDGRIVVAEPMSWRFEDGGDVRAEVTQVPLRLAWAITVHKSQGMTLDAAEVDLSKTFVPGQGYVALSRVGGLESLFLKGLNEQALEVDARVAKADSVLKKRSESARLRLGELSKDEVSKRHRTFIEQSGGSLDTSHVRTKRTNKKTPTIDVTKSALEEKKSIQEIARERDLTEETIVKHIQQLLERGDTLDLEHIRPRSKRFKAILTAFQESEDTKLSPVKRELEGQGIEVTYNDLALARLFVLQDK